MDSPWSRLSGFRSKRSDPAASWAAQPVDHPVPQRSGRPGSTGPAPRGKTGSTRSTGRSGAADRIVSRVKAGRQVGPTGGPLLGSSRAVQAAWSVSGFRGAEVVAGVDGRKLGRKVRLKDLVWMTDQLAATQSAGVPLFRALGMLVKQQAGKPLGVRLAELQRRVGEGMTFSQALNQDARVWGGVLCALVSAGEASGSLDQAFLRAARLLDGRLSLRRKIIGALTYPLVVLMVTVVLVATMLLFVVPKFSEIYDSLDSELPALTRLVVGASSQAPLVGAVGLLAVGGSFLALRFARRDEHMALRIDSVKLRLPLVGKLLARGVYSRVASTLASLLSSGVTLLEALDYAADGAGSAPHRFSLNRIRARLVDGATFSSALEEESEWWPDLMVQLVTVGEEAGSLPPMMERYASRTVEEVDAAATNLTKLIEPLMMVVIGAVVGVFLLALYLPIFDLGSQIS